MRNMKKYIIPSVEVVKIQSVNNLCAVSVVTIGVGGGTLPEYTIGD